MKSIKTEREYEGKIYTINDVPKTYFSKHSDPLKYFIWAKINRKKKYWANPEYYRERAKAARLKNPEWKKAYDKQYKIDNNDYYKKYMREYAIKNKDKIAEYQKGYVKSLSPEKKKKHDALKRKRELKYSQDELYVTRHKLQSQLTSITRTGSKYEGVRYEGYMLNECSEYLINICHKEGTTILEKKKTHHIDHIIPVSYYSKEELYLAYHPLNLRWLPISENCSRQNTIRPEDIAPIKRIPKKLWPKGFKLEDHIK